MESGRRACSTQFWAEVALSLQDLETGLNQGAVLAAASARFHVMLLDAHLTNVVRFKYRHVEK